MKKTLLSLCLFAIVILSSSSISVLDKNGRAGNTGSPGEQTCAGGGCHNGGAPASFSVTISSVPAFTLNQFVPGTTYTMSIDVGAAGFNLFGFGCEILNGLNANAGTMQLIAGTGVKFLNVSVLGNSRRNATHTAPKAGTGQATFSFQWVAPTIDTVATIYVCGNAVNGNNSTSGDKPIPNAPLQLTAYKDTTSHVGIKEIASAAIARVQVFPNPAKDFVTVSIELKQSQNLDLILYDLNGRLIKTLAHVDQAVGTLTKILDVQNVPAGVYFLRINAGDKKLSQKMLVID